MNMVAATVVPAEPLRAATAARSRREAFTTPPVSRPSRSISCRVQADSEAPVDDRDRRRNGARPRTASSTERAVSTLCG